MPADDATLSIILGTPSYYKAFYAYAQKSLAQENLDFLAAAATYRKDPGKKKAIAIIDQFVSDAGASTINVAGPMQRTLVAAGDAFAVERGNAQQLSFFKRHWSANQRKAAENVFDAAIAEIRALAVRELLVPFFKLSTGKAVADDIARHQARPKHAYVLLETGPG